MSELHTEHRPDEIADWQNVADIMHAWHPALQEHTKRIIEQRKIPVDFSTYESQSGRNITGAEIQELPEKVVLRREDITPGNIPKGGTEIVLQRHGKYIRDRESTDAGKLTPEAVQLETDSAIEYFTSLIHRVPEEERSGINVLFVASDTSYANNGQRSYQTTEIAQQVAENLFQENGLHLMNIANISAESKNGGNPIGMQTMREPQMFDKSPDFVSFMREKYGDLGIDFWVAFEEDLEQETRTAMGAEGPDEIADRMNAGLRVLSRFSEAFHEQEPESRLIIWAGTHYDTISPFVKRDVLHLDKSAAVLVDYGGGLVVDVDAEGNASTTISGTEHNVVL